jgi:adenylate cyclase
MANGASQAGMSKSPMADDRERLVSRLKDAGCSTEQIDQAKSEGRLPTLAVEVALGNSARHTLSAVARSSKLDTGFVRELMQAMGRPRPAPRARAFSDDDLEVVRVVRAFVNAGLPRADLLEVARVLSLGMSQTADAMRRAAGNALLNAGDSEFTVGLRYMEAVDRLAPLIPSLLGSELRVHLRHGLRDQTITDAERQAGQLDGTQEIAVGFADLVDYTRLGESLPPEDVGRIAGRLVEICTQEMRAPVTLVKMIGDAAMFVSPEPQPLIDTLQAIVERVAREDHGFPSIRVGVAYGPASNRAGDWFGSTVNLASRTADAARPGRILATEDVQTRAPANDWKRIRRLRSLKGINDRLRLYSLISADDH